MISDIKNKKIKYKFLFIMTAAAVISISVMIVVEYYLLKRSYYNLELSNAELNLKRIVNAIDKEISNLDIICHDWSSWNEVYNFMTSHSNSFVSNNLTYASFQAARFNFICLIDNNKRILFTGGYRYGSRERRIPALFFSSESLVKSGLIPLSSSAKQKRSGIILTEFGFMLTAVRPVLSSDESLPEQGYLIMGRYLNENVLDVIKEQIELNFSLINIHGNLSPDQSDMVRDLMWNNNHPIITFDSRKVIISSLHADIFGDKAYIIRAVFYDSIIREGYKVIIVNIILVISGVLLFIVIVWIVLNIYVINPVNVLISQIKSITRGEYKKENNISSNDELGLLSLVIDDMENTIQQKNSELMAVNNKLELLIITDGLTGIFNRRHFDEKIRSEWSRGRRNSEPLSVIMVDIDFFKKYNDMYGHQAGDECLIMIAGALKGMLHREGDNVFRYGGEEFIAILPNTPLDSAVQIATSFLRAVSGLAKKHEYSPDYGIVTISAGVSSAMPDKNIDYRYLVGLADSALYQSKHNGRHRVNSAETKENGEVIFREYKI